MGLLGGAWPAFVSSALPGGWPDHPGVDAFPVVGWVGACRTVCECRAGEYRLGRDSESELGGGVVGPGLVDADVGSDRGQ